MLPKVDIVSPEALIIKFAFSKFHLFSGINFLKSVSCIHDISAPVSISAMILNLFIKNGTNCFLALIFAEYSLLGG